jgi:hypothetical protein
LSCASQFWTWIFCAALLPHLQEHYSSPSQSHSNNVRPDLSCRNRNSSASNVANFNDKS